MLYWVVNAEVEDGSLSLVVIRTVVAEDVLDVLGGTMVTELDVCVALKEEIDEDDGSGVVRMAVVEVNDEVEGSMVLLEDEGLDVVTAHDVELEYEVGNEALEDLEVVVKEALVTTAEDVELAVGKLCGDEIDELVLTVEEVGVEDDVEEEPPQAPVIDGTASGPLPMLTRFVPQLAALARRRFWLS